MTPSTDSDVGDPNSHPPVIISLYQRVLRICADVDPIIEVGVIFDADIIADAAAIKSAQLVHIDQVVGIVASGRALAPGPSFSQLGHTRSIWDFLSSIEGLWIEVAERYPQAVAAIGDNVIADFKNGRMHNLIRADPQ